MATAHYYRFTPCCVGAHPAFFSVPVTGLPFLPKVYSYSGPTVTDSMGYQLEAGKCYYVEELLSTNLPWVASLFPCPEPDPVTLLPFIETTVEGPCPELPTAECPCTIQPSESYISYSLQPCCGGDPIIIYLVDEYLTEGGTYIYSSTEPYGGLVPSTCYTATRYSYTGAGVPPFQQALVNDFTLVEEGCGDGTFSSICEYLCQNCTCTRFQWTGTIAPGTYEITYIDCNGQIATFDIPTDGTWSDKICLKGVVSTCPNPGICWTTESFGDCNLVDALYECPKCYMLTDCQGIEDPIYTQSIAVDPFVDTQQIITIDGSDTCWKVTISDTACDCAVAVNVVNVFNTCKACINPKGYLLTECTTGAIQYTTTDLSNYTTVIIRTDCGGCWTVQEMDIVPPSSLPVTVLSGFTDCETCNATFYQLTDCLGIADPIVTITDLSAYIGEIVELKYCPQTCWEVTRVDPTEISGDVIVEQSFGSVCADCLTALLTPQCLSFTNTNTIPEIVEYTDINGTSGLRLTLAPGETTIKTCYLSYSARTTVTVTNYGACIEGLCPPMPALPTRSVRPGYNTGTCNPEYYETVECNFADVVYKNVLEQRYGIANCCPEDDIKWEIKHELLMLDILEDPNYVCSTVGCGCQAPCGCNFISLNVIYNTCPNPTPVPPVSNCFLYNVTIDVQIHGTVLHYKNCNGVDTAMVIPPSKNPVMYPVCGIAGQTANDIYCEFPVQSFSFIQTPSTC